jgi:hypothetical protein
MDSRPDNHRLFYLTMLFITFVIQMGNNLFFKMLFKNNNSKRSFKILDVMIYNKTIDINSMYL